MQASKVSTSTGTSFFISLLVLNFYASVLLDATDAMFLLYAIDRDHRTMMPRGQVLTLLSLLVQKYKYGRDVSTLRY